MILPELKLWSPESPVLYPLHVELRRNGKALDAVDGYFAMPKIEIGKDDKGAALPQGTYTVRVKAGATEQTARLTVLADPKSPGTQQSIEAQVAFSREVLAEIDEVARMGNGLESMRKQAQDLMASLTDDVKRAALVKSVRAFESNLSAVEATMIDLRNTGRSEDAFRQPVQLYEPGPDSAD